ncbi:MAG: DUF952 domain-containing protein [Candidatus Binataceae bacterium]
MILHIASRAQWKDASKRGAYTPSSFAADGFIHCSAPEQAIATANEYFRGQLDLLLLCIDERRLTAPLRYEPAAPPAGASTGEPRSGMFPHLYGDLNLDAVTEVLEFPCAADGSFELPAKLTIPHCQ